MIYNKRINLDETQVEKIEEIEKDLCSYGLDRIYGENVLLIAYELSFNNIYRNFMKCNKNFHVYVLIGENPISEKSSICIEEEDFNFSFVFRFDEKNNIVIECQYEGYLYSSFRQNRTIIHPLGVPGELYFDSKTIDYVKDEFIHSKENLTKDCGAFRSTLTKDFIRADETDAVLEFKRIF